MNHLDLIWIIWTFYMNHLDLATCKVLVPCFMSWNKRSQKMSIHTKSLFLSNFDHKFVYIPVSEHFSFANIIHPPDRCDISKSCLNSIIITQVHLVLGTIKGHSKMCSFVTQHNATDVCIHTRHVTHWACLGCSGLMCMTACSNSTSLSQLKRSGTTFSKATVNSLINSMRRRCVVLYEMCRTVWDVSYCMRCIVLYEVHGGHTRCVSYCMRCVVLYEVCRTVWGTWWSHLILYDTSTSLFMCIYLSDQQMQIQSC